MTLRHRTLLLACGVSLVALVPRSLQAAEPSCPAMAAQADAGVRERFPDLVERIQSELSARPDLDACAHIELRLLDQNAIGVLVALPDGRAASRSVGRPEDVIPTLQALLLVPERALAPVPSPPEPAPHALHVAPKVHASHAERDPFSPPVTLMRELGFELSVISGVRIGDGQFGYGAGVLSFLEVSRWLIGFEGRADGYRSVRGGDPETALELAVLGGRRFDLGNVALDVTAGPAVALEGVSFSQTEVAQVDAMPASVRSSEQRAGASPRLLAGARLGFSPRSVFRTFIGIDGEVGPVNSPDALRSDPSSPRMPTFSLGLAVGATVGTR